MSKRYTKEQEMAVTLQNCDLLVSAGAGSGKTTVMIDRVLNALNNGKSVLELLMLTFTNATTSEMRSKLEDEIIKTLNKDDISTSLRTHLNRQLLLVGQADVCTIHGFCQKLIKKFFYAVDANPGFSIIDETESFVLKERALESVFNAYLESNDEKFASLADTYNQKRNLNELSKIILKVYDFMIGQPDFEQFKERVLSLYNDDFDKSEFAKIINNYVVEKLELYKQEFIKLQKESAISDFIKLEELCAKIVNMLDFVNSNNSFSKNFEVVYVMPAFPAKPTVKDDPVWQELADNFGSLKANLKEDIDKIKERIYINENINAVKNNALVSKENLETVFEITKKFRDTYAQLKKESNQLDFADLEHIALKILAVPEIKEQLKNTYAEIFVDEYQDINNIQETIINSLVSKKNHLFLVGDVKQSIYRFRNTNPQIFVEKYEQYKNNDVTQKAIELNDNFRSFSYVLDFSNYIFAKIMTPSIAEIDYKNNGMLKAGIQFKNNANSLPNVEICIVNKIKEENEKPLAEGVYSVEKTEWTEKEESVFSKTEGLIIAEKIAKLIGEQKQIFDPKLNGGAFRDINFSDITLLVRSRGPYLDTVVQTLRTQGVPVSGVSGVGIFEEYEVQVLHNYLCLLANTKDDYCLTAFLLSPAVGLNEQELADIRQKHPDNRFYKCCYLEKENNTKIKFAFDLIEQGRKLVINGSLVDVLNGLILKTNLYARILQMENGKQRVLNMQTYIQHFLTHNYNNDLYAYINYIEFANELDIPIQNQGADNAVQIKTMHESKGLEFPIVFIVDSGHKFNTESLKGNCLLSNNLGIGLEVFDKDSRTKSSTLIRSAMIIEESHQEFAEHLRLLYVAFTRAKNHLFIVGKNEVEKLTPYRNRFDLEKKTDYLSIILTALDAGTIQRLVDGEQQLVVNKGKKDEFYVSVYEPVKDKLNNTSSNLINENKVDNIDIDKFMQYLNEYCTNNYKYQQSTNIALKSSVTKIMQQSEVVSKIVPETEKLEDSENSNTLATEIGNSYHHAMEIIDYNLDSEEEVYNYLLKYLGKDELNLIDCGKILRCIKHFRPLIKDAEVLREQKFFMYLPHNELIKDGVADPILIEGIIDLVIIKDGKATLIDFKTNKVKNPEILREKYKIQMECYQKAVENSKKCTVTQKILYSFFNECEISFDKRLIS